MAHDFDYKKGWAEVINPAFYQMPQSIRDLYTLVCTEAENLHQDRVTLDMPWTPVLKKAFAKIDTEDLAKAARIVYFYGHWSSENHSYAGGGGTWKFANYADQELRARLPIPEGLRATRGPGIGIQVYEGAVRVTWSSRDMWTWEEVAPATEAGLKTALKLVEKLVELRGQSSFNRRNYDISAKVCEEIKKPQYQDWSGYFWEAYHKFSQEQEALRYT